MATTNNKIEIVLSAATAEFDRRLRASTASVKGLDAAAQQAESGGLSAARRGVQSISQSLANMRTAAIAAFSINAIQGYAASFVATADAMRDMDQRLLLTAKNTADYAAAQKTVVEVARDSHQGLAEVSTLYTRMALATANLNVSQKELADVTRTVALATAMSGSSAQEASAGLQQFAQAMASNRLGGDELRSVLENMPLLTKVFVDAAGGSIAKLREMAEKGQLTTQWMIDAIKAAQETIEAQAGAMPMTVGRAMNDLRNEASLYIDSVNQSTGATDKLAGSIKWLSQNLDAVVKGGFLALSAGLSYLAGSGLAVATAGVSSFIGKLAVTPAVVTASTVAVSANARALTGYGMAASIATTQTAANTAAQAAATAAQTAAGSVASRLAPALLGLVNPITAITTVLGIGAAAWAMWGQSAESELDKAKGRVAELKRTNQMLKELSDPGIRLEQTSKNIETARAEVAKLEKDLEEAMSSSLNIPFDNTIGQTAERLDRAHEKLKTAEEEHAETQKNIQITAEQSGVKQIAAEMSVTDAIKKQDEERRKVTASKLENDLAEIAKKRDAELKAAEAQFKNDDLTRVKKAIDARFDAEAAKAKKEADDQAAKKAEVAARKAEAESKRRERALLKEEKLQSKIDIEKERAQSEANILKLEEQKLATDNSGSELERAEKLLEINRQISAERIKLQEEEAKLIEGDPNKSEADVIKAKSEIARAQLAALQQEHSDLARVAGERLADIEEAWRSGTVSVEQYTSALQAAREAGILTEEQLREKKIGAGDDMGAAFSLGLENARKKMESDAEVMILIGEGMGDRISDGLVSAWDGFIMGTESAGEALANFARSTISWLSQVILKQLLMNALMGATGGGTGGGGGLFGMLGMADGGAVQGLAGGGAVHGWSPSRTADNIPIWATAGEFMQPVRAVDYYGIAFMERLRRLEFPRHIAHALAGGTIPSVPSGFRLAQGGMPEAAPQTAVKAGDVNLRIVNVNDRNQVGDYLRSADGETVLLNTIRRNGSTIRTLIGG
ncbi:MAG: tape measure protein [Desulfobulbus sp.]|jgi:tape measure domain-containing protein|uniref:tape measure protein n=1 Tax=Desulfobulbus sp. TaxID=895 RepID=UPI00284C6E20|nr:tape measure protein [Desulfobulbus sp.]MDR2550021.1 tape measure protein [Desulfobulbus sp.]